MKKDTSLALLIMITLLPAVSARPVSACTIPPSEAKELPVEVAYRAGSAGVVIFDRYERGKDEIVFYGRVTRLLWGESDQLKMVRFKIDDRQTYDGTITSAEPHDSSKFWAGRRSNLGYAPNCQLIPNVSLGRRYLFLKVDPLSPFSLEPFSGIDDPWYEMILRLAEKRSHGSEGL